MIIEREIIRLTPHEIEPERAEIFKSQGIRPGSEISANIDTLYQEAEKLFFQLAQPIGVVQGISITEFARIYPGEGRNAKDTPIEHIFSQAQSLALLALTLGPKISKEIDGLLKGGDFSLGFMLDSVASFCADRASTLAEHYFLEKLRKADSADDSTRVLLYSPGYCGWHVSAQGKLFSYLHPEEVGISLNNSFLMIPLKSISGVLLAGDKAIHRFKNDYPFCADCRDKTCRPRIASLR